jgi:hypothetical protein
MKIYAFLEKHQSTIDAWLKETMTPFNTLGSNHVIFYDDESATVFLLKFSHLVTADYTSLFQMPGSVFYKMVR